MTLNFILLLFSSEFTAIADREIQRFGNDIIDLDQICVGSQESSVSVPIQNDNASAPDDDKVNDCLKPNAATGKAPSIEDFSGHLDFSMRISVSGRSKEAHVSKI